MSEADKFARLLMSAERRSWQDPETILRELAVGKGATVADLACGPGFFTIPLASKVGRTGRIYAVDIDPVMLRHLRVNVRMAKIPPGIIKIRQADVTTTRIPSNSVDIVLFANILHDVQDRAGFFHEVKRVAKTNARVVDIDWHKVRTEFGPPPSIRLSESAARSLLRDNGLSVVKTINAGPYHYGLVYRILRRSRKQASKQASREAARPTDERCLVSATHPPHYSEWVM